MNQNELAILIADCLQKGKRIYQGKVVGASNAGGKVQIEMPISVPGFGSLVNAIALNNCIGGTATAFLSDDGTWLALSPAASSTVSIQVTNFRRRRISIKKGTGSVAILFNKFRSDGNPKRPTYPTYLVSPSGDCCEVFNGTGIYESLSSCNALKPPPPEPDFFVQEIDEILEISHAMSVGNSYGNPIRGLPPGITAQITTGTPYRPDFGYIFAELQYMGHPFQVGYYPSFYSNLGDVGEPVIDRQGFAYNGTIRQLSVPIETFDVPGSNDDFNNPRWIEEHKVYGAYIFIKVQFTYKKVFHPINPRDLCPPLSGATTEFWVGGDRPEPIKLDIELNRNERFKTYVTNFGDGLLVTIKHGFMGSHGAESWKYIACFRIEGLQVEKRIFTNPEVLMPLAEDWRASTTTSYKEIPENDDNLDINSVRESTYINIVEDKVLYWDLFLTDENFEFFSNIILQNSLNVDIFVYNLEDMTEIFNQQFLDRESANSKKIIKVFSLESTEGNPLNFSAYFSNL